MPHGAKIMLGLGDMYVHLCAIRPTLPRNAECGLFFDYIWLAHPHPAHYGRFFDYIRPYAALLAPDSKNAPADVGDMAEASGP